MALTTPFQRRKPRPQFPDPSTESSSRNKSASRSSTEAAAATYAARLGRWAARWNHSSLTDITLAHVLSGDTVSPISLSDFETFLTFCDISIENLQFVVWYQDYRARFDALPAKQRSQIQPPSRDVKETAGAGDPYQASASFDAMRRSSSSSAQQSIGNGIEAGLSKDYQDAIQRLAGAARASPLRIDVPKAVERPKPSHLPTPLTILKDNQMPPDYKPTLYSSDPRLSSDDTPQTPTTVFSSTTMLSVADDRTDVFPPSYSRRPYRNSQPFHEEVQNVLATFLVPGSKKELLLASETRDACVRAAQETVHPQAFAAVYEQAYQLVELVSLPRFLANAATNINRPRQLFWYFASIPAFLLGVAVALFFILSPSTHFTIPRQSHRAWRLLSLPLFFLASLCWYKGFRGFCPLLFLRSSRQLRSWELERLSDDSEAQAFVIQLTERPSSSPITGSPALNGGGCGTTAATNVNLNVSSSVPATPISPVESEKAKARIAPFLEHDGSADFDVCPDPAPQSQSQPHSPSEPYFPHCSPTSPTFSSTPLSSRPSPASLFAERGSFLRPPVFGPSRVVEDARIRRVHLHLLWSLVRFGLICTAIAGAVVVAVPSAHSG